MGIPSPRKNDLQYPALRVLLLRFAFPPHFLNELQQHLRLTHQLLYGIRRKMHGLGRCRGYAVDAVYDSDAGGAGILLLVRVSKRQIKTNKIRGFFGVIMLKDAPDL